MIKKLFKGAVSPGNGGGNASSIYIIKVTVCVCVCVCGLFSTRPNFELTFAILSHLAHFYDYYFVGRGKY